MLALRQPEGSDYIIAENRAIARFTTMRRKMSAIVRTLIKKIFSVVRVLPRTTESIKRTLSNVKFYFVQ